MLTFKRFVWCLSIVLCGAFRAYAGDIAIFTDLGFSEDGRYYVFAQYGVEEGTLLPWAELFIVDVAANNFVNDGRVSYKHSRPIEAGQDGSAALYAPLGQHAALTARYGINFLRQGSPLFLSFDENRSNAGETIEFRDFETGAEYRVRLVPSVFGSGGTLASSSLISVERTVPERPPVFLTIGTPAARRPRISSYMLRRALISHDRASMVFVIEMTRQRDENSAPDIRYMVETVRF